MATVQLADKTHKKVDERFAFNSYTESMAGNAYDFEGVKRIKIYNIDTAPLNDYTRSGTSRYGTPQELTDRQYELEMTQDKSATWTIDKGNQLEQFNIKGANQSVKRETDEVVIPVVDKYAFKKWVAGAGSKVILANAMTANTAIAAFNDATECLDNRAVPESGRTCVIKNSKYKLLKQAPQFIYTDKLASACDNLYLCTDDGSVGSDGQCEAAAQHGQRIQRIKLFPLDRKHSVLPVDGSGNGRVYFCRKQAYMLALLRQLPAGIRQ